MSRTLVIVDDDPGFRAVVRDLLTRDGYDVVGEAADGESAIALVATLDPDIALVDVVLPGIDGFAVCDRLAATSADRPAVVLTSTRAATAYPTRLAVSKARGFLAKSDLSGPALAALTKRP